MPGMPRKPPSHKHSALLNAVRCRMAACLVDDWRQAWRFASVLASLALALLSLVQANLLPLLAPLFPPDVWPWVTFGFGVLIMLVRVLKQRLERHQVRREQYDGDRP